MDFTDHTTTTSSDYDRFKQEAMSQDLGLDPSDPLNLLLNNNGQDSSMEDSNSSHGSPPDWSQLSSTLWPNQNNQGENMKYPDLGMEFLQMDMEFNPSMSVDPSALHYNNQTYNTAFDLSSYENPHMPNDLLSASFPFTFSSHPSPEASVSSNDFGSSTKERRLSVTSSSESSSGASLSPVLEHTPAVVSNDPMDELAQRVRQAAGVMLAVPMGSQYQTQQPGEYLNQYSPMFMFNFLL